MHQSRIRAIVAMGTLAAIAACPGLAFAENAPTPELMKLQTAWNEIFNYSVSIVDHEVTNDGKGIADRTFTFKLLKPSLMQIDVTDGLGKGSGAVWHGGDTIKGHQGGFLSGIHLAIRKDDARARSLRGDEIDSPSIGWQLAHLLNTPGVLSDGKTEAGATTITFTPTVAEPNGITREILVIDPQSHLPVRHVQYFGATLVKTETFNDLKVNPGLTEKDFDPA